MKLQQYIDDDGYKHLVVLRNNDDDPSIGIPNDPPDLELLDWAKIKKDIHNLLVDHRLVTWIDIQRSHGKLQNIINSVMKRELITLYKLEANE